MDKTQRCDPGGPAPTSWAIVGEAPGADEIRENRGFVGQSGELLWPLIRRWAGVDRDRCWVTSVSKHRLDDTLPSDKKLSATEFAACRDELLEELTWIAQPKRVLAVGSIAARALMGDAYTSMDDCNGMTWVDPHPERGWTVVPCFHPAAALRGGGEAKLGWTAQAIAAWGGKVERPEPRPNPRWVAIDTEGWPDDPILLTFAYRDAQGRLMSGAVDPESVPAWWGDTLEDGETVIIWHNALWDWRVVEAMGVPEPWRIPFEDTMERAYIRTCEPQGLKALAWRHLGVRMRTYEEVTRPAWEEMVREYAEGLVEAGTRFEAKVSKSGKLLKAKLVVDEDVKPIKRALKNVDLLAERLGFGPPDLRYVPRAEMEAYAVEDAVVTLRLRELL